MTPQSCHPGAGPACFYFEITLSFAELCGYFFLENVAKLEGICFPQKTWG